MSSRPPNNVGWLLRLRERHLADKRWLDSHDTETIKDKPELVLAKLRRVEARLNELEGVLTWHTTCVGCARTLESSYNEYVRRDLAENALTAIRAAHRPCRDETCEETDVHKRYRGLGTFCEVEHERYPCSTIQVLTTVAGTVFRGPGGNAEDCQVCAFRRDLVYPFLCDCPVPETGEENDDDEP